MAAATTPTGSISQSTNLPRSTRPNQPRSIEFPSRLFGKTCRRFQKNWFNSFVWLDYDEPKDIVYCHTCRTAERCNQLNVPSKELTLIKTGFSNWKDAPTKSRNHEKSSCHHVAVQCVVPQTRDVAEMVVSEHAKEKEHNRQMLLLILKCIRFLGCQGLALRGDSDEKDSNFMQTLKVVGNVEEVKKWLLRKTEKYTSPEIQNEMLKLMQKIAVSLQSGVCVFFSIMCDECTDSANKEQLVICLRWVDELMEVLEDFIGLY